MTGWIEAGVLIFMALIGAPLLAVIMGFAMMGHSSIILMQSMRISWKLTGWTLSRSKSTSARSKS